MNVKKIKTLSRKVVKKSRQILIDQHLLKRKYPEENRELYLDYMEKMPLNEKTVLLEASHGENLSGNIFYLLKELMANPEFNDFEVCLSYAKGKRELFEKILEENHIPADRIHLLRVHSEQYYQTIATAKYLINDTTFLPFFIKRAGQVYLNTWHGIPLKNLGYSDKGGRWNMGNVMKNFVVSDYLLYPDRFMEEVMIKDYGLENLAPGKIMRAAYPRNEIFTDENAAENIRVQLKKQNYIPETVKKIYAYMPTWRGSVGMAQDDNYGIVTQEYLTQLDGKLGEDEMMLVNMHPLAKQSIDLTGFSHIKEFPKGYETYEVLNGADALVTDYSSVFFDYAVTGKNIVLFTFDEEEYMEERGMYFDMKELPFPQVKNTRDLLAALRAGKTYDDTRFMARFNPYSSVNTSRKILETVLLNKPAVELADMPVNGKENVFIYPGNLARNGITTSLMSLLNNVDLSKRNYYLTFRSSSVKPNWPILMTMPEELRYFPISGIMNGYYQEKKNIREFRKGKYPDKEAEKIMDRLYGADRYRNFGDVHIDTFIHFNGYEYPVLQKVSRMPVKNKVLYIHNNAVEDVKLNTQHEPSLRYAYDHFDKLAIVTEDMREPAMKFCKDPSKFRVVHNLIDYKTIEEKGNAELAFDEKTESTHSLEDIKAIFDSPAKVLINVARFAPEKGQMRLIKSFEKVHEEHPDSYLMIIGGHGKLYEEILDYVQKSPIGDHIIIIKSVANPQPFIKKSDGFVFSSFSEGFGLVLAEADIQGVPVVSTDILGPRGFMLEHHGCLVENDEKGIEEGMRKLLRGEVPLLNVDYEAYNKEAVAQFNGLFDDEAA